jgi:triosephosphate isomerase
MTARKTIIAGNWKMHKTVTEARALALALHEALEKDFGKDVAQSAQKAANVLPEVVISPTYVCSSEVKNALKNSVIQVSAQNMDHRDSGAYTGEIAPGMLTEIGLTHVIIGHSERRQYFGETDESVNLKVKAALTHKLVPIVCVGETLAQREANETDTVVTTQITRALSGIEAAGAAKVVIAYEPVWAIGTGKNCDAKEANRVCGLIRSTINSIYAASGNAALGAGVPVLYGGSVKPSTIDEQMEQTDIDGALVGGASLKVEEFLPIIKGGAKRVKAALEAGLAKA